VVTWTDRNGPGGSTALEGQLFDAAGAKIGGEFQVNTFAAHGFSDVSALPGGGFVAVWESVIPGSSIALSRRRTPRLSHCHPR
jgi:hypothetical protein